MRCDARKRLGLALFVLTVALLFPGATHADEKVYQQVLPSVVWIHTPLRDGKTSYGSGVLVDVTKRWILTNAHVVADQTNVRVYFVDRVGGLPVAEREHYLRPENKLAIRGHVLRRDARRDLAVIQLEYLPVDAQALPLSSQGARPGQDVHLVGNPGFGGALWVYTSGTVRQIYKKNWTARLATGGVANLEAQVVETQLPINPGDSGGPVVNMAGELVAVVSSFDRDQQLVSTCISVSEVKDLLQQADGPVLVLAEKKPLVLPPAIEKTVPYLPAVSEKSTLPPPLTNNPPVLPAPTHKADPRVAKTLQQANLHYEIEADGVYKINLMRDSSSPLIYVDSSTDRFRTIETRRVWAIAKVFQGAPPADLPLKLLLATHTRKLGAWEIMVLQKTNQYCLLYCCRVNAEVSAEELRSTIEFVHAEAADLRLGILPGGEALPPGPDPLLPGHHVPQH
jgi:hypothetical protein